jgi:transcriptional regulator with GAF, ATPase, and Fis domain
VAHAICELHPPRQPPARRSGLEAGDLNYAGYGAVTETWPALPIANDLDHFVREYEPAVLLLEKLRLSDFLAALRVMLNWALALQGRTAARLSLSTDQFDEGAFIAKFENEPFFRTFFYVAKLQLCVLLEETESGLEAARRARQGTIAGTIWPVLVDFWGGLALTAADGTASEESRASSWRQLIASQRSLAVLADNCPENYRCFSLLLSAEMKRISSQYDQARRLCVEAIAYARETQNLQQQALANELCAKTVLASDGESDAAPFLHEAHRCYAAWGASVKVQQMEEKYGRLLTTQPTLAPDNLAVLETVTGPQSASLDLATILKASHAIAVEIELDELLRKLMQIALENAGAERGVFISERTGQLVVQAEATAEPIAVTVLQAVPIGERSKLARTIVNYVRTTAQCVVVGDASNDDRFLSDPYIASARPRSILCAPAVYQGKLKGILYLENNLATDVFTADRINVLDILCAQAAISLENARLYDEMKQEATRRRRAEELLRAITEGTSDVTGSDFFRALVQHLATALRVRYAFVAECLPNHHARSLAFWNNGALDDNFTYDLEGTPCLSVVAGRACFYPASLQNLFPADKALVDLGAESYLGVPLIDVGRRVTGHLVVMDDHAMEPDPLRLSVLETFAARAGAELERLRTEDDLRKALTEVETLKTRLQAENVYLQDEIHGAHNFEEMVGSHPRLLDALQKVERVAPTDATVLIYGETGTGKELIARAIHNRSARKDRPLVKVNCGAIPAGLVESELFGHMKGAFTGAIDRRTGRFELAHRGTIFLDEVGELPLDMQVKLLRVLQEQEFEPIGSSRTVRVDVRVIAATNRDLEESVRAGRFRSDLFFRLNVLPLRVPPLRERRSDVPQLVAFFLSRSCKKLGKKVDAVAQETMDLLINYAWPGNIRELQNVIERAVVLASGPVLKLDRDLLPQVSAPGEVATTEGAANAGQPSASPLQSLDEIERLHILSVLDHTHGVVEGPSGAARILNLHPNTLRSRMKKLGLQRPGSYAS